MKYSRQFIIEKTINVLLVLLSIPIAMNLYGSLVEEFRLSVLLLLFKEMLIVFFVLIRAMPREHTKSPFQWYVAVMGSCLTFALVPYESGEYVVAEILQVIGVIITTLGLLALNKSFGIVPANRGIKTTGMYGFVRHPLYLGYILSDIAFVINNLFWWNFIASAGVVFFLILRIRFEEKLLMQDVRYQEFSKKTKYRLLPYIY